jgi:hypothetical protein
VNESAQVVNMWDCSQQTENLLGLMLGSRMQLSNQISRLVALSFKSAISATKG